MNRAGLAGTGYLALDNVAGDPQVARLLPPEVAWRLHALPVAEDNGRITVAMANPDDPAARDAIVAALGPVACVVRADPGVIDSHLARIWGQQAPHRLSLAACCFPQPVSEEVWGYFQAVGRLLGAGLNRVDTQAKLEAALGEHGTAEADVVFFADARHPSISRFLARAAGARQPDSRATPSALWVAPQPRWPLHRVLLIVGGTAADAAAVDWVVRVVLPGASTVTILTIVPPVPAMYGRRGRVDQGLSALLASASPLGHNMREAARRLVESKVEAVLRLRAGPPEWQVCHEIVEGDHDLVVLAVEHAHPWLRWLEGDLIGPLLCQIDRPFLIAAANSEREPPG